jgi:hypothetical protein
MSGRDEIGREFFFSWGRCGDCGDSCFFWKMETPGIFEKFSSNLEHGKYRQKLIFENDLKF